MSTAGGTSTTAPIQDLSPDGVRRSLAALAEAAKSGDPLEDAHDEAHLAAFEDRARVVYGELELHRRNPLIHLAGLDLACYDRDYAPEADRDQARLAQLAAWPQAIDAAVAALDQVSAPVATALAAGIAGPDERHPGRGPDRAVPPPRRRRMPGWSPISSRPPPPAIPTPRSAARRWRR